MLIRAFSRAKPQFSIPAILHQLTSINHHSLTIRPDSGLFPSTSANGFLEREYHDGRPRGPLWRGKKLIGKEALFVILGLKRFKDDEEKLAKFIKTHVVRLLKMDMIAVLTELQRQEQVSLALKWRP